MALPLPGEPSQPWPCHAPAPSPLQLRALAFRPFAAAAGVLNGLLLLPAACPFPGPSLEEGLSCAGRLWAQVALLGVLLPLCLLGLLELRLRRSFRRLCLGASWAEGGRGWAAAPAPRPRPPRPELYVKIVARVKS